MSLYLSFNAYNAHISFAIKACLELLFEPESPLAWVIIELSIIFEVMNYISNISILFFSRVSQKKVVGKKSKHKKITGEQYKSELRNE